MDTFPEPDRLPASTRPVRKALAEALVHFLCTASLFFVFLPTIPGPLFSIDDRDLLDFPPLRAKPAWTALRGIFLHPGSHYDYYPVRDLSYWMEFQWGRGTPGAFRFHAILLLAGCAVLFSRILRRWGVGPWWALCAAWAWAFWPNHPEMVVWISARKDLLALFFILFSFFFWQKGKIWAQASALLCFWLSLLSKVSFLAAPLLLLATYLWKRRAGSPRKRSQEIFLSLGVVSAAAWAAFTSRFYAQFTDMTLPYPTTYRLSGSVEALGRSVVGWFLPSWNAVDVINWGDWVDLNRGFLGAGLAVYALSAGAFFLAWRRKDGPLLLALASAWAFYLPVSALFFPHRNFYSVRYLEPSFLALFAYVAWRLRDHRVRPSLIPLGLAMLLFAQNIQARVWVLPSEVSGHALWLRPTSIPLRAQAMADLMSAHATSPQEMALRQAAVRSLLTSLEQDCEGEKKVSYAIDPCTLYYRHAYEITNSALPERRHQMKKLYLAAVAPIKPRVGALQAFAFSVREGNLDASLAERETAAFAQAPPVSVEERRHYLLALCYLGEAARAKAQLNEYRKDALLPLRQTPAGLTQETPAYEDLMRACLREDFQGVQS